MIKFLRIINTLNIDTALSAVSFAFVVSFIQQKEVSSIIYLALIINVLSIYNIDHLIDGYRLNITHKSSFRHYYYLNNSKKMVVWQVFLLLVGIWVLYMLPPKIILAGTLMCCFIVMYFYLILKFRSKNYLLRETIVAAGYTFSVAIIPFFASSFRFYLDINFYGIFLIIFLVALTNLLVFAIYDYKLDKTQKQHSIAIRVDSKKMVRMVKIIIGITLVIILSYFGYNHLWILGSTFLIVEITYFIMLVNQSFFKQNDYYRLVGESFLSLPGFALLIMYVI